ncbi:aprataxin and PNK-like factor, partial [Asbolus verrucosus]
MFVKIFKLGEEEDVITVFPLGTHAVGRGPVLQNHINPCFLKVAGSKTVTILTKDSSSPLNDGDTFALLPDLFWFKVKVVAEEEASDSTQDEKETKNEHAPKRHLDDVEEETSEKRTKLDETKQDRIDESATTSDANVQAMNAIKIEEEEENKPTTSDDNLQANNVVETKEENSFKEESTDDAARNEHTVDSNQELKMEPDLAQANNGTDASTSDTKAKLKRERCWYGARCYRKNPVHRQEFTHPGDSDFESDPDDNRPTCSFGAACYRKNKDHRRDYKHPPRQPPNKKKRTRKKVDRLNAVDFDDDLSEVSEDPFAVDGDSDEYVEDSDSDDTDWEDSQNVEEDSENMRSLVKEANRFVR